MAVGKYKQKEKKKNISKSSESKISDNASTTTVKDKSKPGCLKNRSKAIPLSAPVQKKVTVGQAGDSYEREADNVADHVTSGKSAPEISSIPAGGLRSQSKDAEGDSAQTAIIQREAENGAEDTAAETAQMQEAEPEQKTEAQASTLQTRADAGPADEGDAQSKCAACEKEYAQRPAKGVAQKSSEEGDTQTKAETGGDEESAQSSDDADNTAQMQAYAGDEPAQTGMDSGADEHAQESSEESEQGENTEETEEQDSAGDNEEREGENGDAEEEGEAGNEEGQGLEEANQEASNELGCGEEEGAGGESEGGAEAGGGCGAAREAPAAEEEPGADAASENAAEQAGEQQAEQAEQQGSGGCESRRAAATQSAPDGGGVVQEQPTEIPAPPEQPSVQARGDEETAQGKVEETAQGQDEEPVQAKEEETAQNQEEETTQEKVEESAQGKDEPQEQEEGGDLQTKAITAQARQQQKGKIAAQAIQSRGAGTPLPEDTRERLEGSMGVDLGHVRVHSDGHAQQANKGLRAKAFTHKNHIWLGSGQSATDVKLMAHEVTHTVQQGSVEKKSRVASRKNSEADDEASNNFAATSDDNSVQPQTDMESADAVQGKSAVGVKKSKQQTEEYAPGEIDLQGKEKLDEFPAEMDDWLAKRKRPWRTGYVNARFGSVAKGTIKVTRKGKDNYRIYGRQSMLMQHPLFQYLSLVSTELQPRLFLYSKGRSLHGHVGLSKEGKYQSADKLYKYLSKNQEMLGLGGVSLKIPRTLFVLNKGNLKFGPVNLGVAMGESFKGSIVLTAVNEKITQFEGDVNVSVPGLASGAVNLKRNEQGLVSGKVDLDVTLTKQFSGAVTVAYDGKLFSGSGTITYSGEKLIGKLTLSMMELAKEQAMVDKKKASGLAGGAAAPEVASKGVDKKKKGADRFVLFGEGDLTFAFTDWLNGNANVVVDRKGYVTIIGKITPQKEFELFRKYDLADKLPKIGPFEIRASYGIPVVGNIYVGASLELGPFAFIGPGRLKDIEVGGTYSTDPAKNQDFSITGTIYIPAAAGLSLTAKGKVGIVILSHDISAGAGITADAGIGGYAEAKPVIGYREKNNDGQDKKGEFFIKGDLTIAAQPFFALQGFLFVELDSPWWSPAPDKTWKWPLFGKSWPLGEPIGIAASVEHVIGSGEWPKVDFKKPKFDMDKFMGDMIHDRTEGKTASKKEKGQWKERNSKAATSPAKGSAGAPPKSMIDTKPSANAGKKTGTPIAKGGRTADGRKVADLKKEAAVKAGKPAAGVDAKKSKTLDKDKKTRWREGSAEVKRIMRKVKPKQRNVTALNKLLAPIKKRWGYRRLEAVADKKEKDFNIMGGMSPDEEITEVPGSGFATKDNPLSLEYPKRSSDLYPDLYLGPRLGSKNRLVITQSELKSATGDEQAKDNIATKLPAAARKRWEDTGKEIKIFRPHGKQQLPQHNKEIGIAPEWQIYSGRLLRLKPPKKGTPGGGKINRALKPYGFFPSSEYMDGDHVLEIQLGGKDTLPNLWPLDASENRSAGSVLSTKSFTKPDGTSISMSELKKEAKVRQSKGKDVWLKISSTKSV